jgi:hypothetical protein
MWGNSGPARAAEQGQTHLGLCESERRVTKHREPGGRRLIQPSLSFKHGPRNVERGSAQLSAAASHSTKTHRQAHAKSNKTHVIGGEYVCAQSQQLGDGRGVATTRRRVQRRPGVLRIPDGHGRAPAHQRGRCVRVSPERGEVQRSVALLRSRACVVRRTAPSAGAR